MSTTETWGSDRNCHDSPGTGTSNKINNIYKNDLVYFMRFVLYNYIFCFHCALHALVTYQVLKRPLDIYTPGDIHLPETKPKKCIE